ncbi:MAG TPA: BatD family protein [Verrucomicrobiae bacterium]|nr:BatD family protein [Verrucomicrobiae bacterium]
MTGLHGKSTGFSPGRIHPWIRLVFGVMMLAVARLHAATFTATLDHDTILLGDTATLSLKFDGGDPTSPPSLPDLPGLEFPNASTPSVSRFDINGQHTLVLSLIVKPTQTGDFTIPALNVKVGGETLTSEPIRFKVVRPTAPAPGSAAEQQSLALLRLALPQQQLFTGQTFVLEMQLLLHGGIKGIGGADLPGLQRPLQLDGCTVGKAVESQQRQTVIGNTSFTVVPVQIPVTVLKAGKLQIGPLDGAVVVTLPSRRRDPMDFDPFGMFDRGVQQRVALATPAQTLDVLPLPETGRPATFTGAVGRFELAVSAGPTNVAVGDPITVRIQIHGRGSLDSFTLPAQAAWKEFKIYPPTAKTDTTGELGLEGTKTFEQVVVPQNTEIKEIPPFEFSYFDPEKRAYETLRQAARPIIVRPSGSTPAPSADIAVTAAPGNPSPAEDIVHIKPRLGVVRRLTTPWIEQPWFVALQAVPLLGFLGVVCWRKRTDALANNPRLRRQRHVAQVVNAGLIELQGQAAAQQAGQFFATVFRLLQEQIGERLDLPATAITEAVVDEKLRARGLPGPTAEALHGLFQLCNQARYAPTQPAQVLAAVIPKVEDALRALQEVKG